MRGMPRWPCLYLVRTLTSRRGFTVLWNPTATAYSSAHGQRTRRLDETLMTSLGIPFSDLLNEDVSQLVAQLVSSVNGSIEKHAHIVGHLLLNLCPRMCMHILGHKLSNKLLNLLLV